MSSSIQIQKSKYLTQRLRLLSMTCLSVVTIGALVSFDALAQSQAQAQAQSQAQADPETTQIVVTGSGYRVKRDSVLSNIDVLSRAQIDEKPATGLGDMLAYMPGVRSSSFAPGASRPIIRGLDGFRVLVLNNGMGVVDVSALSPDHAVPSDPTEAKRIEVLRGPSALAYGGNAIGGVVNVVDERIPSLAPKNGLEGTLALQGSSADQGRQGAINFKAGTGPFILSFDAFSHKSSDYTTPSSPMTLGYSMALGEPNDARRKQTNSATDMRNLGAGVSYIGDFGLLGLSYKTTDYTYGTAIEETVHIELQQKRYDAKAEFNLKDMAFSRLNIAAGYSDYNHAEIEGVDMGTQFLAKGSEFRAALVRDDKGLWSGTVGVSGFKRDFEAIGSEAFVPSTQTTQGGVFSQFRYDTGVWGVDFGARLDQTKLKSVGIDRDFKTTSSSIGGFYRSSDHAFFGLSVTRSQRAPSDVELLANGPHIATGQFIVGNSSFKTEVGTGLEFTTHLMLDEHNHIGIDAHIYSSRFSHFIDLIPTGLEVDGLPEFRYAQSNASLYGVEIEAFANLGTLANQGLKLNVGYDFVRGKTGLGHIARIPPQALTLKLDAVGGGFTSSIELRSVQARTLRLAAFETPTKGYSMLNLFTSFKLPYAPRTSIFAEVRNATNAQIREATSFTKDAIIAPSRSLRLGLIYNF